MNLDIGSVHIPTLVAAVVVILGVLALLRLVLGVLK